MERIYIGIFGRTNAGKSTLLNRLVGGDVAMVSPVAGTTTDAVRKNGEILGLGAVTYIDTAGFDDTSALGAQRIEGTRAAMEQVDIALLVYREWGEVEESLMRELAGVPVVLVQNSSSQRHHESVSLRGARSATWQPQREHGRDCHVALRAPSNDIHTNDTEKIFAAIKKALPEQRKPTMFGDSVKKGDRVVLVMPQDSEAPAGRLILPQVQAIRELLDIGAIAVAVQPAELEQALNPMPQLIVTDSQVIAEVRRIGQQHTSGVILSEAKNLGETPMSPQILSAAKNDSLPPITSFSILLAAARGDRQLYEKGLLATENLKDGDRILIAESCTHQSSCDDIGRVKIPRWLREYTGKQLEFTTVSGLAPLPADLHDYAMAIQCGGCMVSRRQLLNRLKRIDAAGVPVTNYGMLINKITQSLF